MTTLMASPETAVAERYFDLDAALDRCCGDPDFLAEMIDLLETTVAERLVSLEAACRAASPKELSDAAHALKGAVSSMTLAAPYELARELEFLGKDGKTEGAEALLGALHVSLEQLLRETRTWAQQRTTTA